MQEADDDERSSSTTTGEKVGGRRSAGRSGATRAAGTAATAPRPERARPNYLARRREPGPTTSPKQQVRRGVERVYKGESGHSAKESATHDHLTEPNRTP